MMSDPGVIRIAAAVLMRADGATLLVPKRGTTVFMQPGGKIDVHEEPVQALCRELAEELGLRIPSSDAKYIGRFRAEAANEVDHVVIADIFCVETDAIIKLEAEIEEVRWIHASSAANLELAPLTRDYILPLVCSWVPEVRNT